MRLSTLSSMGMDNQLRLNAFPCGFLTLSSKNLQTNHTPPPTMKNASRKGLIRLKEVY